MRFGVFSSQFEENPGVKFKLLPRHLEAWFFAVFLLVLPLGSRLLLLHFWGDFPADTASVFIYGSDVIALVFLFSVFLRSSRVIRKDFVDFFLLGLLLFSLLSIWPSFSKGLALWQSVKLFEGILIFWAVRLFFSERFLERSPGQDDRLRPKYLFPFLVFIASGLAQAILAIGQFIRQSSFGLIYLGEPSLGLNYSGSAKFLVDGARIVRPAGTLPHANVLSAFILAAILTLWCIWLFQHSSLKLTKTPWPYPFEFIYGYFREGLGLLVFVLVLFPLLLAFVLTFSRTGWAALALMLVSAALMILFKPSLARKYGRPFFLAALMAIFILGIFAFTFSSFVISRNPSLDEFAVSQRFVYNNAAIAMIKDHPWLGVGNGNFVLGLRAYLSQPFPSWWLQPVHNVFLLVGSELGIFSLILLIGLFIALWLRTSWLGKVVLIGLLVIMMTDHYLWTMQQGRLLFWLGLGVVAASQQSGTEPRRAISDAYGVAPHPETNVFKIS